MRQEIETRTALIHIDEEGILRLKIKEDVTVKKQDVEEMLEVYRKLGCDKKKVLQLMEVRSFIVFEMSALGHASQHLQEFFIACGLVSSNAGITFTYNFFNRIFKHGVPFKMFSAEKKALNWVRQFREQ